MPRVYLETTVISYLTAWRSPQLVMAANQQVTRECWDGERLRCETFVSAPVIQELSGGDPTAARRRLEAIAGTPELPVSEAAEQLAGRLLDRSALPSKARVDALHLAIAAVHGMNNLLTWNCGTSPIRTFRN